jgi:hypothetical protein
MADLEITNNTNSQNQNQSPDQNEDPGEGLSITQMQADKKPAANQEQSGDKEKQMNIAAEDITGELQEESRGRQGEKFSESISKILESKQGKTYSTAILSILLVAVMFFFAITPAVSSITSQLEVNAELRERINSMTTKQQNLNTLLAKDRENTSSIEEFKSILGNDLNESIDYETLLELLDSNNMQLRSINFSEQRGIPEEYVELGASSKLRNVNVRLVVLGSLSGATSLTADIEANKRLYDIEEITISEPEDIRDTDDYQVEYNLRAFYWQQFEEE